MDQALHISQSNIYKIFILNALGKIQKIIIFSGGLKNQSHMSELFSDIENSEINANKIEIVFSDFLLHTDDSIRIIKKKIIQILGTDKIAYEEIYMFSTIKANINLENIYKNVVKSDKGKNIPKELETAQFGQLIQNLNIPDKIIETIGVKDIYTYEDLTSFGKEHTIEISIGQKFMNEPDYLYSANPFKIRNTTTTRFETTHDNPILTFENELLLNYGHIIGKSIYVCLAESYYEFAFNNEIDSEYITALYYPQLFSKRIISNTQLVDAKSELLKETAKLMTGASMHLYKTVDMFYKIFSNKKSDLEYLEKGIQSFSFVIQNKSNMNIPLESIFKNLHASKHIPFIKYNPGNRRENMYRLYTELISKNGKKIPFLSESAIMKLSRDTGKSKQISLYISELDLYIDFESNGNIYVRSVLKVPIVYDAWNELMKTHVNPVIQIFNNIIQQTGISLYLIESLRDNYIDILNIKYVLAIPSIKILSIKKYVSCISSIFNVITDDLTKEVKMQFKRVANFKEMDALSELITQILKNTNDYQEVVRLLMLNYSMTHEAAIIKIAEYTSDNKELSGKILENPGFPVRIFHPLNQKKLVVEIENIISTEYLDNLDIYIDSILRIISTDDYPKEEVKLNCSKTSKFEKDVDKSHFDNVIAPTRLDSIMPHKKIQPLTFNFDDDDDDDNVLNQTNVFLDDETESLDGSNLDDSGVNENDEPFIDSLDNPVDSNSPDFIIDYEPEESPIVSTSELPKPELLVNPGQVENGQVENGQVENGQVENGQNEDSQSIESGFMLDYDSEHDSESSDTLEPPHTLEKQSKGGEDTPTPEQNINIDGMSLHNIFLNRMKDKDPKLFLTKKEGKYSAYSKSCAANINRQPVILTESEKTEIDLKNPGSYSNAVKYGSDPDSQFWYICPRYWCLKTNTSISKEDVIAGKCGNIIPPGSKTVPKGAYVYEFNSHTKEHLNTKGEYIEHYPSFFEDSHPDGHCVPCCFKLQQNETTGEWEMSKEQLKRRERCAKDTKEEKANPAEKFISYIKSSSIIPLEPKRWGFLPINAQLFLKTNNAAATVKTNNAQIRPNTPCLLRYGVEQQLNQSFLGCVAEMYGYKQGIAVPKISVLKQKMVESLTIDLFIKYHNGSLITIFKPNIIEMSEIIIDSPEFQDSEFIKNIDMDNELQYDFLVKTISAFQNFKKYLLDNTQLIDHTYIWDMIIGYNPKFMKDGLNLIIMEIANTDITDKIELICPTNSYATMVYDPRKETVLVLKQGEFYELVYLYEERDGKIHELKTFINKPTTLQNIIELLTLVQNATKKYCSPNDSRPRIYNFNKNILANELYNILITIQYEVSSQIMNYQGKIIGLLTKHDDSAITSFVPCLPSNKIDDIPIKYMDEDIWIDYNTTISALRRIKIDSKNRILCNPRIKILEDGLIIGIITETNQFIQITPPSENILVDDGLETINSSSYIEADTVIETSKTPDLLRNNAIKKIALESNFFAIFRTIIRNLLNQYENHELRKQILQLLDSPHKMYIQKLKSCIELLHKLVKDTVQFQDIELDEILAFDDTTGCSKNANTDATTDATTDANKSKKLYCLKEGDIYNIPSRHLISDLENEKIYYSRIADELIRYNRIRLFMFQPNFYLNITDNEYKINSNEFMILQSNIGTDYFKGFIPFNSNPYITNISYEIAEPSVTQNYSNEISLEEQSNMILPSNTNIESSYMVECIKKRDKVIGNIQNSLWKRIFPKTVDEIIFKNTVSCSYSAIISVLQVRLKSAISIQNVKAFLWNGYKELMAEYEPKIISILKLQGKTDMTDRIIEKKVTLETFIFSEEYYITDLDLWVLCKTAQLPIILFSSTKLNQLSPSIDWILLGGNVHDTLHFIRSPSQITLNTPPEYHLISQSFPFSELKEFRQIMEQAVAGSDFKQNIQGLENYLQSFTMFTKKRIPIKKIA